MQFDKKASQTRAYCSASTAPDRAARLDPSRRKNGLLKMTTELHRYRINTDFGILSSSFLSTTAGARGDLAVL
jgi:hypothetical protein